MSRVIFNRVALTDQRPNQPTLLETSLGIEDVSLGYRDRADHRHRWVFDVLAPPRALDALRYLSLVHDAIDGSGIGVMDVITPAPTKGTSKAASESTSFTMLGKPRAPAT